MNHFFALVIKFIIGVIAYAIALDLFFQATWVDIVTFSLLMTAVTYLLGDRILLPRLGNVNALIVDFVLSYLIVWIFGSVLLNSYVQIAWGSIISAVILVIGEAVVHRLLLSAYDAKETNDENFSRRFAYDMEIGKERDPLK